MYQQEQAIGGELTPCRDCGRQPRHYFKPGPHRHFLECACKPVPNRTTDAGTFQEAVMMWEHDNAPAEARA